MEFLGRHTVYVEPYFGSGAVLLAKPRVRCELVNDLDGEVANFYRMLRDRTDELVELCELSPCAEKEWRDAKGPSVGSDELERARRFFVRTCQSHGSAANGGWIPSSGTSNLGNKWVRSLRRLRPVAERLQGVQVASRDALGMLGSVVGRSGTAVYLDPPYLMDTVTKGDHYREKDGLSLGHHSQMLDLAVTVDGVVVISHYDHPMYTEKLAGWNKHVFNSVHTGNPQLGGRTMKSEVVWVNREPSTLF